MNIQSSKAKSFYQKPRFKENHIMQLIGTIAVGYSTFITLQYFWDS